MLEELKDMSLTENPLSPQVHHILVETERLTTVERLMLAWLLLDSVLVSELADEANWSAMSLEAFQKDWDNPEDAIYDNWRELYGVSTR